MLPLELWLRVVPYVPGGGVLPVRETCRLLCRECSGEAWRRQVRRRWGMTTKQYGGWRQRYSELRRRDDGWRRHHALSIQAVDQRGPDRVRDVASTSDSRDAVIVNKGRELYIVRRGSCKRLSMRAFCASDLVLPLWPEERIVVAVANSGVLEVDLKTWPRYRLASVLSKPGASPPLPCEDSPSNILYLTRRGASVICVAENETVPTMVRMSDWATLSWPCPERVEKITAAAGRGDILVTANTHRTATRWRFLPGGGIVHETRAWCDTPILCLCLGGKDQFVTVEAAVINVWWLDGNSRAPMHSLCAPASRPLRGVHAAEDLVVVIAADGRALVWDDKPVSDASAPVWHCVAQKASDVCILSRRVIVLVNGLESRVLDPVSRTCKGMAWLAPDDPIEVYTVGEQAKGVALVGRNGCVDLVRQRIEEDGWLRQVRALFGSGVQAGAVVEMMPLPQAESPPQRKKNRL